MSKRAGKILVGALIAGGGICIGGQACGLLPGTLSMDGWWTVFLIVPGVLLLACVGLNAFDALLTGLGVLFLLDEQGVLPAGLGYRLAIPYGLVAVGLAVAFTREKKDGAPASSGGVFAGSSEKYCFAIGGSNVPQLGGGNFQDGLRALAIFGGVCLDLRGVELPADSVVHLCTIFGAARVLLPEGARLTVSSFPVFGRLQNACVSSGDPDAPAVAIKSVSVFGGVHIQ